MRFGRTDAQFWRMTPAQLVSLIDWEVASQPDEDGNPRPRPDAVRRARTGESLMTLASMGRM